MKILVVDRDDITANLIKSRAEPMGHYVLIHPEKGEKLDHTLRQEWNLVMIDPAPMTAIRPLVMGIKRNLRSSSHIVLMSDSIGEREAIDSGCNDLLSKPLDRSKIEPLINRADFMTQLTAHLSNDKIDFPSAGGVISKSAYNQLFLSCIDRAGRYGEGSYTIFFTINNYNAIITESGEYEASMVSAKLARHLVRIRRQSDIIAQIRENEYALLLLKTMTDSEPMEATHRFIEFLGRCTDLPATPYMDVDITVALVSLPHGEKVVEHKLSLSQN